MAAPVKEFLKRNFRHFNAATLVDAAEAYRRLVEDRNGRMMVTLAGAMSTGELGLSLAEMIRQDKVHAISCTGANLEEDMFNLVAHESYVRVPNYRDLTPEDEDKLVQKHLARVTDTCIPEEEAMRKTESHLLKLWKEAEAKGVSKLPHEYFYELIERGILKSEYQIDPKDSWLVAAAEKKLPLFVPGWEDSTLGNNFAAHILKGNLKGTQCMKTGIDYMMELARWYQKESAERPIGFFQIGGGIAGDFPICVVPMIQFDMKTDVPLWAYFCQISDSTTSYGSYSGAVPNEKITWGKLGKKSEKYMIESDATIVAPLIFAYLLNW
ncbi:MAG: deoxyhypusine synthase [Bradymonadales bacterium]|nr:MAG: deoxyhypusine synthase [Bradymonadales bacterium]